jgi:dTDP-4-dehydrorhamnose 3,5-epimerase
VWLEQTGRRPVIFRETALPGTFLVELERHEDERGFFARAWCSREFAQHGLAAELVQCNLVHNDAAGTLRGLHYQVEPSSEAKLVRCVRGALYDVAVDLRPGSPTFRRWVGVELTAENRSALYVPEGCAHGYQTLTDATEALYLTSAFYAPDDERGVRWDDPAFAIEWPEATARTISDKDRSWPDFAD